MNIIVKHNYLLIGSLMLIILGVCVAILTLLKKSKNSQYTKPVRIISLCMLILGGIGLSVNVLNGYHFHNQKWTSTYMDEYNYIPISLLVLSILSICLLFLTFLKSGKNIKSMRIISIGVLILGIIGIAVNALKGYYFNGLESDILLKQSIGGTVLFPSKDVYYEVNTKYGVIKSIDENEYIERSRNQSEYRETISKESQQILETAGYDIFIEDGKTYFITLNNNIYFVTDNGNGEQSCMKYDNLTATVDNNFSPKFLSTRYTMGLSGLSISALKEVAAIDTYPELANCVQRYETNQITYGDIMISNGRIVICMIDNSEPNDANWILYEYDPYLNDFKLLCKARHSNIKDIIFLS